MTSPFARLLPDGKRLHLQQGPIDLVIDADGEASEVALAFEQAKVAFEPVLTVLVSELDVLRRPLKPSPLAGEGWVGGIPQKPDESESLSKKIAKSLPQFQNQKLSRLNPPHPVPPPQGERELKLRVRPSGPVAQIMTSAASNFAAHNVTLMIAVAGSVADYILGKMQTGRNLDRVYVNNGGDIALYLNDGHSFDIGIVDRVDAPEISATAHITSSDTVRGVATSGWRGRSFSLGVADAVTVLAPTAALADAAATLIANEIDPGACAEIARTPAHDLDPDSDLGSRLVTTDVQALSVRQKDMALQCGHNLAQWFIQDGLISAAALSLQGSTRLAGNLNNKIALEHPYPEKQYARG